MRRRDFLDPRRFTSQPTPPSPPEFALVRLARNAMATTFEVIFPFGHTEDAGEQALDLIDRLEDQLTVYRDHSEISKLNASGGPMQVEENLFELLSLCQHLWKETDGAFDISVGALIKAWGFYRRQGQVPERAERDQVRPRIGMQHVSLDPQTRTVQLQTEGLEINLGSVGKGYALDRVAQLLWKDHGIRSALMHGGKSSVFSLGSEPGATDGWPVGISDPRQEGRRLGVVRLKHRGLGTSAATLQNLIHEGRRLGHILDPRTLWPAEGMLQASVTAPSAAVADALATAFFIRGVDFARAYCETHPDIGALLLPDLPRARPVVLGTCREELVK